MTLFIKNKRVNIDITNRCPLLCPECQRQQDPKSRKFGGDITIENFIKVTNFFTDGISFCGQRSDPIHHPQFIEFLEICRIQDLDTAVHCASTFKPLEWYEEAFDTNKMAKWWLALDGKPEDSPKYRINQDGYKMVEIMKLASKKLHIQPFWQCILFNFNQHYIDELNVMAKDIGIKLLILESHRWDTIEWMKPVNVN